MTSRKLSVDELAARIRAAARAKPLGPLQRVLYFGAKCDYLACGHMVPCCSEMSKRRHCSKCARGVPPIRPKTLK